MTTYASLDAARAAADRKVVSCIAEVETAAGRCYVQSRANAKMLREAVAAGKVPGILRVLADFPAIAPSAAPLGPVACDRCGCRVDPAAAYHQDERTRVGGRAAKVRAYYCDPCRRTLAAVGSGEGSALDARAAEMAAPEPASKGD